LRLMRLGCANKLACAHHKACAFVSRLTDDLDSSTTILNNNNHSPYSLECLLSSGRKYFAAREGRRMKRRKLGNSELEIAPLAFGGNVFGWTADEQTSFKLLDAFVSAGFNLIDTADVYSAWAQGNQGGESETIIGRWLKRSGRREQIIIATKVGMEMRGAKGLSKSYILRSAEDSLRRLQTDYIDLYQSHQDDPETPLEETLEAYAELMRQGKVRVIGASNYDARRLREALVTSEREGLPRYESLQPLYNLYDREAFEAELEPLCLERNVGVINYFALASGFLSGKYRSEADAERSARGGGVVKKYLNERGLKILYALDEVAGRLKSTPAQVALAWLIARPSITAPIASATSLEQLSELTKATELELDETSLELLNEASEWRAQGLGSQALKSSA
jgi:aryl-alcohol dehydrogenase-like predicted oxidoreductase